MRTIESEIVSAMRDRRTTGLSKRDAVIGNPNGAVYLLWGTPVVKWNAGNRTVTLDSGGWRTSTTRSRINGILFGLDIPVRVLQKNFDWYLIGTDRINVPFKDGVEISY